MAPNTAGRDSVRFSTEVEGGDDGSLRHELDNDATVEHIGIRIYRGPRHDLRVRPLAETIDGNEYGLIKTVGKEWIDGEDDVLSFDVSESLHEGDSIVVEYENQEQDYAYDFVVDVTLEYEGGIGRSVRSLLGGGS